jgi:hypothetical protein
MTCMGDIYLTPNIVEQILVWQREHPYDGKRILIVSITDGKLILAERKDCNDLSHTAYIYPMSHHPIYDSSSYRYLYTVSVETGKQMSKMDMEMYGGDAPIERRLGNYWNVILTRDATEMNLSLCTWVMT